MKSTILQLKDHNEGRPTDKRIKINPKNWGSETEPQACEHKGKWYYNAPAMELLDWVPNNDFWEQKINEGFKPEFAGYRSWNNGQYYLQGTNGYYWSSSPNSTYSYVAGFYSGGGVIAKGPNRGYGFSVRCLKNKEKESTETPVQEEPKASDSSTLRLFVTPTPKHLQETIE